MNKFISLIVFFLIAQNSFSQDIQVRYDYDASGNAMFGADNYSKIPVFLVLDFSYMNYASFSEDLPYIKRIDPGSTELFVIYKELDQPSPEFNIEYKWYNSNPNPDTDVGFPYLLPAKSGTLIKRINIRTDSKDRSVGFALLHSDEVYAARKGVVIKIVDNFRQGNGKQFNYLHVLHEDGTIGEYFNLKFMGVDCNIGETVFPGQLIGWANTGKDDLPLIGFTVFHSVLFSEKVKYIVPEFYLGKSVVKQLSESVEYKSVHSADIIRKELTRKEKRSLK